MPESPQKLIYGLGDAALAQVHDAQTMKESPPAVMLAELLIDAQSVPVVADGRIGLLAIKARATCALAFFLHLFPPRLQYRITRMVN